MSNLVVSNTHAVALRCYDIRMFSNDWFWYTNVAALEEQQLPLNLFYHETVLSHQQAQRWVKRVFSVF